MRLLALLSALALLAGCTPVRAAAAPPNTINLALSDRKTGILPVMENSASRLSANETTGWKPVGTDRQDACPPAKLTVLGGTPTLLEVSLGPRDDRRLADHPGQQ